MVIGILYTLSSLPISSPAAGAAFEVLRKRWEPKPSKAMTALVKHQGLVGKSDNLLQLKHVKAPRNLIAPWFPVEIFLLTNPLISETGENSTTRMGLST